MTLDDMIRSRNSSGRGRGCGFGRGWGRGRGGSQRGPGPRDSYGSSRMMTSGRGRNPHDSLRVNVRPSASTIAKPFQRARNFPWKQDLLEDSMAASALSSLDNETKLLVSNLDGGVSPVDIRDIFSAVGEIKRYALHYGKDGLPTGTAEVVFSKRDDALYALKQYNNVKLDGRPLKIELISPNIQVPVSASASASARINVFHGVNGGAVRRVTLPGAARPKPVAPVNHVTQVNHVAAVNRAPPQRARGGGMMTSGRGRGRGRGGGRGRGRVQPQAQSYNRGKKPRKQWKPKEKSAVELDKELDKYHAEAMETS